MKFCPFCAEELILHPIEGKERLGCPHRTCGYIFWNSPIPVVGGIVETVQGVILAHNKHWPPNIYSIITGFLGADESPEDAIVRETREELGLVSSTSALVGTYPYLEKNQLILVYHLRAMGEMVLGEEIDDFQIFTREDLRRWPFGQDKLEGWPFGAGWAIRDWLSSHEVISLS